MPENVNVVGFARTAMTKEQFVSAIEKGIKLKEEDKKRFLQVRGHTVGEREMTEQICRDVCT